jgi:BirA family transcriptional regulator, biotin operon repressor / biotin---[acetyl-CoA-carboxylase] ligase
LKSSHSDLPAEFADALEQARPHLGRLAPDVFYFHTIGSTNDVAAALAAGGNREGAVVVADTQTSGRGRRGHIWFSPPASGLYVSVVLAPGRALVPERAIALVTLSAGVALVDAIEHATGLSAGLKWPNDLYVGRRKLAGILAEGVTSDTIVLGYGINVGRMSYPPELADRATALEVELGRAVDRAALFAETLVALARRYDDLLAGRFDAILDDWRARAPGSRGARVSWESRSGLRSGVTAGVDERGALLVQVDDHIERIIAGELTWL